MPEESTTTSFPFDEIAEHFVGRIVVEPEVSGLPARTPGDVFARELRATRKRKRWTQQQLADRLADLDCPLAQPVIAKIERGQRKVSIDELFAFAAALGVSAAALAVPRDSHTNVRVAPNLTVTSYTVHRWLRGICTLTAPTTLDLDEATADQRFFDDSRPDFEAVAFARLPVLRQLIGDAWSIVTVASGAREPAESALFRIELERLARDVAEVIQRIREATTEGD